MGKLRRWVIEERETSDETINQRDLEGNLVPEGHWIRLRTILAVING